MQCTALDKACVEFFRKFFEKSFVLTKYYKNCEDGWGIVFTLRAAATPQKGLWGYGGVESTQNCPAATPM
jgi:hypothetical protein